MVELILENDINGSISGCTSDEADTQKLPDTLYLTCLYGLRIVGRKARLGAGRQSRVPMSELCPDKV